MDFGKVVAGAFLYVGRCKRVLVKALVFPFLLYFAIEVLISLDINPVAYWSLVLLSFGIYAIFAITTHRVLLLGPDSVPTFGIAFWSKREAFFFLHLIGLYLVIAALSFLLTNSIADLVFLGLMCWGIGRVCLVFPGIAVDKGVSFKQSWEMTANHQLLMFLVVIMLPGLLMIIPALFSYLPYSFLLKPFVSTLVLVLEVAALSMAYQMITGQYRMLRAA